MGHMILNPELGLCHPHSGKGTLLNLEAEANHWEKLLDQFVPLLTVGSIKHPFSFYRSVQWLASRAQGCQRCHIRDSKNGGGKVFFKGSIGSCAMHSREF